MRITAYPFGKGKLHSFTGTEALYRPYGKVHPCTSTEALYRLYGKVHRCTGTEALYRPYGTVHRCTGTEDLYRPTAQTESRVIALPFHNHGTRRGEGSASRPSRSLPWENPVSIVQEADGYSFNIPYYQSSMRVVGFHSHLSSLIF
jgi:hypothetical protein